MLMKLHFLRRSAAANDGTTLAYNKILVRSVFPKRVLGFIIGRADLNMYFKCSSTASTVDSPFFKEKRMLQKDFTSKRLIFQIFSRFNNVCSP